MKHQIIKMSISSISNTFQGKQTLALFIISIVICQGFAILTPSSKAQPSSAPEVICVPFHGKLLGVPHDAWIGKEIVLKGTAHDSDGDGTLISYKWDFGDGYATDWIIGVNPYAIEARHTYIGTMADGTTYGPGKFFTAWLYVKDSEENIGKDGYFIAIRDVSDPKKNLEFEVNVAIDNGLWWLHKALYRYSDGGIDYGYWSDAGYYVGPTSTAVLAFEIHGHLPSGDKSEDPYVETVQRGLNYIFTQCYSQSISGPGSSCPYGNPDTNGNCIGIDVSSSRPVYEIGMVMMAIAASGDPNLVAATGPMNVVGRTYFNILTDMVDMCSWGQNEAGYGRGGWRYNWNYGDSDNSVTQWPIIGLEAAETNWGIEAPDFVKPELSIWLAYSQSVTGGFGYTAPEDWVNPAKTGAGLCGLAYIGLLSTDIKVVKAISYLDLLWGTSGTEGYWGNYYSLYAIMKGCRLFHPEIEYIGSHDWYWDDPDGFARYLVNQQMSDGNWPTGAWTGYVLDTGWAILALTPTITFGPPVANAGPDVANHPPDPVPVKFDASGSYHTDPTKKIVMYEWDFESDGIWDYSGIYVKVEHAYPAYRNPDGSIDWDRTSKDYTATLRVTDDSNPPSQDTDTCVVHITAPPWKPVANPGGPYEGWVGVSIRLDGSKSYDPESKMYSPDHPWYETIEKYEWDLDNDGQFDDSFEVKPTYTWDTKGTYSLGLRVTDSVPSGPGGSIGPLDVDVKYTTVVIGAEPEEWSFAVITDLHIGRGYADYGGEGYDDEGTEGQNYYLTNRLIETVDWIIKNSENYNIRFVTVLGDIADSAEYSELDKAKEILSRLDDPDGNPATDDAIPYVSVIGNHDVWPNTEDDESDWPESDLYFRKIFIKERLELLESFFEDWDSPVLTEDVTWCDIHGFEKKWTALLQNYAFKYKGTKFIVLDCVAREPIMGPGKGVGSDAVLWDGTLAWLTENLHADEPTVILSHHPFIINGLMAFTRLEIETIDEVIKISKAKVMANFAGHIHGYYNPYEPWLPPLNPPFMDANVIYVGPEGMSVVVTEAMMVGSNEPTTKGIIRIVKVKDEDVIIPFKVEGEFNTLNPYFKQIEVIPWIVGFPPKRVWEAEFELYAFTKLYPLFYTLDFDDGPPHWIEAHGGLYPPVEVEHNYPKEGGTYNVELIASKSMADGHVIERITKVMVIPYWKMGLGFFIKSPVDILVADPDHLIVSNQVNEIMGAIYFEIDMDGDGSSDDTITLPERKIGDYLVTVIPETDSKPIDTYTLGILTEDDTAILFAVNVQICDIPTHPYIIRSTETEIIPIIPAIVHFDPDTLNLKSEGQWVTTYIELPVGHGYDISMIDLASVKLNDKVSAEAKPTEVVDYDSDGIPDLMVKFNNKAVQGILKIGNKVRITISGKLMDSRSFEGQDTIKVISRKE